jgi:hypothetical protein
MALAVWILYAADRLLDSSRNTASAQLEARHHFHRRHARAFVAGIAIAALALAAILPQLDHAAIRLYLIEGALLFVWFLILHATKSAHRLPKEIAVGIFFSAAIFIPTIARRPDFRQQLLPSAVLFAALCALNCLFIYKWEHEWPLSPARSQPAHCTTHIAVAHISTLAISLIVVACFLIFSMPPTAKFIAAACALSTVSLLALNHQRLKISRTHIRACADLALLTPIVFLPFLR